MSAFHEINLSVTKMEQFELFSRKGAKDAKKDMKKLSELCAFARGMYFLTVSNKYCLSYFGHTQINLLIIWGI